MWPADTGCQEVQTNDDKEKGKTVRQEKKKTITGQDEKLGQLSR